MRENGCWELELYLGVVLEVLEVVVVVVVVVVVRFDSSMVDDMAMVVILMVF